MANLKNLFPTLVSDDFIAAASALGGDDRTAAEVAAGREKVDSWAQHGSSELIPTYKLPNIAIGDVHTVQLDDSETTDVGGTPSLTDIITYLNSAAAATDLSSDGGTTLADPFHEGDVAIVTGTIAAGQPGKTLNAEFDGATLTFLYTNGTPAGKAPGTGGGFVAGDFHQIASTAVGGVTSLTANNSLTVDMSTGAVQIELDDSIHAKDGTATFTVGRDEDTAGTPAAQATVINGTGVTIDSAAAATLDGATGAAVTSAAATSVTGGTGVSITATTGEIDLTATAANVDINAGTTVAIDAGSTASLTGATGLSLAATANELDLTAGGAIDINAGTNVTIDAGGEDTNVTITSGGGAGVASLNYDVDNHINVSSSGVLIDGTLTLDGLGSGTTDLSAGDNVLVVDGSGVVGERNLASIGVGAYDFNTIADGAAATVTAGQLNSVLYVVPQSQAATITLPAGTANGQWLKIINNSGRVDTTLSSSANQFLGTADTTVVLDDSTANFEMIWVADNDGAGSGTQGSWAIITA